MLLNATLIRIDPPPPAPSPGPPLDVRCAATEASANQMGLSVAIGVAVRVLYVRLDLLPVGVAPQTGGSVVFHVDGEEEDTTLEVTRVLSRPGRLAHAEAWLAPAGTRAPGCGCA